MKKKIAIILLNIALFATNPVCAEKAKLYPFKQIITRTQSKWKKYTPEQKKRIITNTLVGMAIAGIAFYGGLKLAGWNHNKRWPQKKNELFNQWKRAETEKKQKIEKTKKELKAQKKEERKITCHQQANKGIREGNLEKVRQALRDGAIEEEIAHFDNALYYLERAHITKKNEELGARISIALIIFKKSQKEQTEKVIKLANLLQKINTL